MKSKKVKKILAIVLVSIVLALTVATIVLALVPKKLYNPMPKRDFAGMTIYRDEIPNAYYYDGENLDDPEVIEVNGVIDDIVALMDKSVQDNMLSSMFQGALGREVEVEKLGSKITGTNLEDLYDKAGVLAIVFNYLGEDQSLKINGEVFEYKTYFSSKEVKYDKIIMSISNNESYDDCMMYLVDDNGCEYTVTFYAHQSEIYEYIKGLKWPLFKS